VPGVPTQAMPRCSRTQRLKGLAFKHSGYLSRSVRSTRAFRYLRVDTQCSPPRGANGAALGYQGTLAQLHGQSPHLSLIVFKGFDSTCRNKLKAVISPPLEAAVG